MNASREMGRGMMPAGILLTGEGMEVGQSIGPGSDQGVILVAPGHLCQGQRNGSGFIRSFKRAEAKTGPVVGLGRFLWRAGR